MSAANGNGNGCKCHSDTCPLGQFSIQTGESTRRGGRDEGQSIIMSVTYLATNHLPQDQQDHPVCVAHVQCWLLIANFEARNANFSRACVSLGRAIRMAQLLNLHQLDRDSNSSPPSIFPTIMQPPQDWCELEERRRTWWVAYVSDRLLFATSGLPALIDDQDASFTPETRLEGERY
jgi:hypothetical protein